MPQRELNQVYVVDPGNKLLGIVAFKQLLFAERGQSTAIAIGADTVDATVTAAGIFSCRLTWGTTTAATSAPTAPARTAVVFMGLRRLLSLGTLIRWPKSMRLQGRPPGR